MLPTVENKHNTLGLHWYRYGRYGIVHGCWKVFMHCKMGVKSYNCIADLPTQILVFTVGTGTVVTGTML